MASTPSILAALRDRHLFGGVPAFRHLTTWEPWLVALGAIYGLGLTPAQQARFCKHTGRSRYAPPPGGWKEVVIVVGRQSGKTRCASLIADYEATFAQTERGTGDLYALLIAQDHRAALRAVFSYATGPFEDIPILRHAVRDKKADSIGLQNGVILAAYPCRPAAVRGLRASVVVCDELGFFRNSEGSPQDTEMLRAVRPTLATTGGRLIVLSSPAGQQGALWDLFQNHYGRDDSPVLIWQASAPEMNPTLPADYLARMELDDPEGYRSEVLGEFRAGTTALFDPEAIRACVVPERRELAPAAGRVYRAFVDASGGRRDAFTCAVGHREGTRVVLDALRVWHAPFNPSSVTAECASSLRHYGLARIRGDRFGAEWVAEAFRVQGVKYDESPLPSSDLYLEMLPAVNAGQVELLDLHDLRQELIGLERRRGPSGRDRVVHPPSRHDDMANAVAGLVQMLAVRHRRMFEKDGSQSPEEQKPMTPPPSEPWLPGRGVVAAGKEPFYWTHKACGNQRLVDPAAEKEPYRCPRCQPNWTGRDVLLRGQLF
jgi:hypothetical protein